MTFYLIKKYSDTKWEEFKAKNWKYVPKKIGTYEINKIPLSCFDDKRNFALDDEIHTLAYFRKDWRK